MAPLSRSCPKCQGTMQYRLGEFECPQCHHREPAVSAAEMEAAERATPHGPGFARPWRPPGQPAAAKPGYRPPSVPGEEPKPKSIYAPRAAAPLTVYSDPGVFTGPEGYRYDYLRLEKHAYFAVATALIVVSWFFWRRLVEYAMLSLPRSDLVYYYTIPDSYYIYQWSVPSTVLYALVSTAIGLGVLSYVLYGVHLWIKWLFLAFAGVNVIWVVFATIGALANSRFMAELVFWRGWAGGLLVFAIVTAQLAWIAWFAWILWRDIRRINP